MKKSYFEDSEYVERAKNRDPGRDSGLVFPSPAFLGHVLHVTIAGPLAVGGGGGAGAFSSTHVRLNQTGAALSSCSKCIRASQSFYTQPPVRSGGEWDQRNVGGMNR